MPSKKAVPPRPPNRFRIAARRYALDVVLLLVSFSGFVAFGKDSLLMRRTVGAASVARLTGGTASIREAGAKEFRPARIGSEFRNMDSVWVGKGASAAFELEDGPVLELSEKTLITFKRPFKPGSRNEDRMMLTRGKAKVVEKSGQSRVEERANAFDEIPSAAKAAEIAAAPAAKRKAGIYPTQGTPIYLRPGAETAPIGFTWLEARSGHLVIAPVDGARPEYHPVRNQSSIQIPAPKLGKYHWQVVDESKSVVVGPFAFEVKLLTEDSMKKMVEDALLNGKPGDSIDVKF